MFLRPSKEVLRMWPNASEVNWAYLGCGVRVVVRLTFASVDVDIAQSNL